ncbi:MAG: fatty acid CoA ligase family protein [Wenzhouxiangella sp.]|nr:fatty acid CoA ligase family protein [Wenzhouxiangella sp.]
MSNIAEALARQATQQGDAVALVIPKKPTATGWVDERLTYRELNDQVEALARGLVVKGLAKGTRVALMVPPSPMFFVSFFALMRAGCVPILVDPGIGLKPLKQCLAEAEPQVFMGINKAQWARRVFGWGKASIEHTITVGSRWASVSDAALTKLGLVHREATKLPKVAPDDPAAILFTSGSTGIPKGVVYRHRHFEAQVTLVRETYGIQAGEIDCPTFPPFALFDPALGMTTVIPKMDFTKPASVDPKMLVSLIEHYQVTNLFGSPALMNTLTTYTQQHKIKLPTLKRVLSAGAPVSPKVVERMHRALNQDADIHTPYGATEVLPVATVSGRQIVNGLAARHRNGQGICVGKALSANQVKIIAIDDGAIERLDQAKILGVESVGEICVAGPSVTDQYWARPEQTAEAKMVGEDGEVWHRMGDLGWLDDEGRVWFCGRKSERVVTEDGVLFTECVEGIVNAVSGVYRSALVGVDPSGQSGGGVKTPVVVVELESGQQTQPVIDAVKAELQVRPLTQSIERVEPHPGLPVDIRHNAKIKRGALAEAFAKC